RYEDTAHFFCSLACAAEFARQPERFAREQSSRGWPLALCFPGRDLSERLRRRVDVRDQVERSGQQLERDEPRHLCDQLVAVPESAEPVDVCVADLGGSCEHLLG